MASWIGGAFGILPIALGVWQALSGDFVGGIWHALIGLFVYAAAQASYQQVVIREGLRGVPVRRIMTGQCGRRAGGISVAELIDDYVYRHHHSMFPGRRQRSPGRLRQHARHQTAAARPVVRRKDRGDHAAVLGIDRGKSGYRCHGGALAHDPEPETPGCW